MQYLKKLIAIDRASVVPVYLQIVNKLIMVIGQGVLSPGSKLPSTRTLSQLLEVHRKTIVAAYEELLAQNWIMTAPRRGVYVATHLPVLKPKKIASKGELPNYARKTSYKLDRQKIVPLKDYNTGKGIRIVLNDGYPDTRLAPVDELFRESKRMAGYKSTRRFLSYGPELGSQALREELVRFMSETRGLHIQQSNILITRGTQMALFLVAQILITKGDTVVVGNPGYPGANEVFEQCGANLETIAVDDNGIDLHALDTICKRKNVRLLYIIPHHHYPTTATLSADRRMQLLEMATQYHFAILEDDYDYDFHYTSSPLMPLASVDYKGSVIYTGSFSKIMAPGIRLGFMIAPENLIMEAARFRKLIGGQSEVFLEEALASLLKNGDINRLLKKNNKIYLDRRNTFCTLLQDKLSNEIRFSVPDGGLAIWAQFAKELQLPAIASRAAALGLYISQEDLYYHGRFPRANAIRLGFAALNNSELEEAVTLLEKAIKSGR